VRHVLLQPRFHNSFRIYNLSRFHYLVYIVGVEAIEQLGYVQRKSELSNLGRLQEMIQESFRDCSPSTMQPQISPLPKAAVGRLLLRLGFVKLVIDLLEQHLLIFGQ
jgi:hypothetical protein